MDFHGLPDHEKCIGIVGRVDKVAIAIFPFSTDKALVDRSLRAPLIYYVNAVR